jgi:hypothetical protein
VSFVLLFCILFFLKLRFRSVSSIVIEVGYNVKEIKRLHWLPGVIAEQKISTTCVELVIIIKEESHGTIIAYPGFCRNTACRDPMV